MKYFVLGTIVSVFFCSTVFGVWWLVCRFSGLPLNLCDFTLVLLVSFICLYFRKDVERYCEEEEEEDLTVDEV